MASFSDWGSAKPSRLAAICIGAIRYRIARGALKKPLRRILLDIGGPYDVEVEGLRMRLHVGDNATERTVLERGVRRNRILSRIIQNLGPGDVFVDVGANCGLFTLFAARKVGSRGRVIAIEPLPAMIERLRFNINANNFFNIDVFETAVGDDIGITTLYVDNNQFGRSCTSPMEGYQPISVPVISLEAVIKASGITKSDALKIDIEGHEDRALLPFISSVARETWPKRIMMETLFANRWKKDCIEELIKEGYRQTWRSKNNILLEIDQWPR